jgi:hypothetical protein
MLVFVMLASLMSGSAAYVLTSLSGSSVPPAAAALPFLVLRCLLPGGPSAGQWAMALRDNVWLVAFVAYGSVGAYLLPRIFAGQIYVTPLRPIPTNDPFVTYPLVFTAQNVTVSVYLLLTLAASICTYLVIFRPGNGIKIAQTAAIVGIVHALLGFASVAFAGTPLAAGLEFFRNGSYAQLDQNIAGFVRMNGIAPEPSGYAIFGFTYCVLNCELWWRGVARAWTRPASLLLLSALLLSTSSTSYLGLGGYALVWIARLALNLAGFGARGLAVLLAAALLCAIAVTLFILLAPALAETIVLIANRVLFEKGDSQSGMQRLFWAMQGFEAFRASGGLGIGMGSFRSSSLFTAILGSGGIIGAICFLLHLGSAFGPLRASTYSVTVGTEVDVGIAAAWTALLMLIPAAFTSASPDPGLSWGLMCGLALSLRRSGLSSQSGTRGLSSDINMSHPASIAGYEPQRR